METSDAMLERAIRDALIDNPSLSVSAIAELVARNKRALVDQWALDELAKLIRSEAKRKRRTSVGS